jgi:hypothetical protein
MSTKPFLFCLVFFVSSVAFAQNDHVYLKNTGNIPAQFLGDQIDTALRYDDLDKNKVQKNSKLFENFQLRSNYELKKLLNGGRVIYSGPVYEYVNKVAQKIISNEKSLQGNIKIYILLDASVNAMTLNTGEIFVNVGLLAHLKTEAELAFVLCHEFAHYEEKHVFESIVESNKVVKNSREYKLYDDNDIDLYLNKYSRDNETEADLLGFKMFLKLGYKKEEALNVLEVLKYANYPYENVVITKEEFESTYLKIPNSYFPASSSEIVLDDFYKDTTHTHPNIGQRKLNIQTAIRIDKSSSDATFIISEQDFFKVRNMCRYELSTIYLTEQDYIASLYNTLVLLKGNPNSLYLNRCLIKAYSYIQNIYNNNRISVLVSNPKKVLGETQKLHYFFSKVNKEELNAFVLKKSWVVYTNFQNDPEIKLYTSEITKQFVYNVNASINFFQPAERYSDSLISSFYANDTLSINTVGNKYTKRKTKKVSAPVKTFAPYVMADFLQNENFISVFNIHAKSKQEFDRIAKREEGIEIEEDDDNYVEQNFFFRIFKNEKKAKGPKIDNFILLDVAHLKFDERKSQTIQFVASADRRKLLLELMEEYAKQNGVKMHMLVPERFSSNDVDLFNDRALLENWANEQLSNTLIKDKINIRHSDLLALSEKYNTNYVGFMMSIGFVEKKYYGNFVYSLIGSLVVPPLIIPTVVNLFSPDVGYIMVFKIYDVHTGKSVYSFKKLYNNSGTPDLIKSEIYNQFNQLYKSEGK